MQFYINTVLWGLYYCQLLFVFLLFQSKLSKGDHRLKKNVMFNLQHASKALIDKKYHNAIKLYETALNEIEKHKVLVYYRYPDYMSCGMYSSHPFSLHVCIMWHMLCSCCLNVFSTVIVCHYNPHVCHPHVLSHMCTQYFVVVTSVFVYALCNCLSL